MKPVIQRKFIRTKVKVNNGNLNTISSSNIKSKSQLVHHVFFWLHHPDSIEDRSQLIAGIKTLAAIETVLKLQVGILANTEKRDVVDTSWQVSEGVFFNDEASQAIYQDHPLHQTFIKNCSHLWSKVVVYDATIV